MTALPPANDSHDDGEIYSPAMDDGGFDAREGSGRRAMLLLAGAFGFLLLLAIILLKVYAPGTRGDGQPPRILADTSPYKSAPENPGGVETPNQDKSVYDVISGNAGSETVTLVPDSEDPVTIDPTPPAATVIVKKPDLAPATKPAAARPDPIVTQTPSPSVRTGSSQYVVQVASLRSQDEANESWTYLNQKVGDLIPSALYADIKRADLEGKGVFYRLRVAGFADKSAAKGFCDQLKARKQDCIVVSQ